MSHLTTESLARLVDESPTEDEQSHLDGCPRCREALEELHAQTVALGALPAPMPPTDAWQRIAARVDADRRVALHSGWTGGTALRAAAAAAVFALGTATGVIVSRDQRPASAESASAASAVRTTTVSTVTAPDIALARLRIAEMMYTSALLDYAAITSPQPPRDAVARLATLETIVLTTQAALERAPADPLINSYHLAALAERQTLLGQLRRTPETKQWY